MQNNDFDEQLQQLWQQQQTVKVDVGQLKHAAKWMRIKQFGYAFLDIACVASAIIVMYSFRDHYSTVFLYGMSVFIFIALVFTIYLLYLRRHALLNRLASESTQGYLSLMVKQTNNNMKIAWITQHSCWLTWIVLVVFWLYLGAYDDMPSNVLQRKALLSVGLSAVIFIPMWFWTTWRRKKFIRMRDELIAQQASD